MDVALEPGELQGIDHLVERAKRGDRAAMGALYNRFRARIFALALHLSGSRDRADDITQDVFMCAFRRLPQFAGRSEFFTWLYRIAVNRSLNARRDDKRRRPAAGLDDPRVLTAVAVDAYGDPRRAAELRQLYSRLVGALDQLPAALRTTVVLVSLQGLSHEEAAVVMGCPEGTVSWRMHQARALLREALNPEPPPARLALARSTRRPSPTRASLLLAPARPARA